jgi:lysophospholipase L1-like esterase
MLFTPCTHPLFLLMLVVSLLVPGSARAADEDVVGNDLRKLFAAASSGRPIRAVAIGGSITQAGDGWIEPWLKHTFLKSSVVMHNAGISATGSDLGMFRLHRDVIATQPELVLIEFAVNDGGRSEDDVIWTIESCVRRLKLLAHPPAIVMIEVAHRKRPIEAAPPQRKVANHYGLLTIDLNRAILDKIRVDQVRWEDLFTDDVHPTAKGHAFYAQTIADVLASLIGSSKADASSSPLPAPLSKRALVLDGELAPLPVARDGWTKEPAPSVWWGRFFNDFTACKTGGKVLELPFRGTVVGLFYATNTSYGTIYASVDGMKPRPVPCNIRDGYSSSIVGERLAPGEHILRVVVPTDGTGANGVKLGYLLTGGGGDKSDATAAAQGDYNAVRMARLSIGVIPNRKWAWVGPFGDLSRPATNDHRDLHTVFWPEASLVNGTPPSHDENADPEAWRQANKESAIIDFSKATGFKDRGVCYAWTVIEADAPLTLQGELLLDYWGKVWINGVLAADITEHSGSPYDPVPIELKLNGGQNHILVKVHSGSAGCMFSLRIPDCPDSVRVKYPTETGKG